MTKKELTPRQMDALNAIKVRIKKHGYPPTIKDIADDLGVSSTNGVREHLKALVSKGHISRTQHARSIRLL